MYEIQQKKFEELTSTELYELLKLRVDVFVVEQQCAYPELYDKDCDRDTHHILMYEQNQLVAYARCLAPNSTFTDACAIGRVVVAKQARGKGLANALMTQAMQACLDRWPQSDLKISAQSYLLGFYGQLGFEVCSEPYLEDGLPHQDMKLVK